MTAITPPRAHRHQVAADLPLFALTQLFCTAVAVLLAKTVAFWYTFRLPSLSQTLERLPSVVAYDLLLLGAAASPILLSTTLSFPLYRPFRLVALTGIYLGFSVWTLLSFANAAFLMTLGASLDPDLLDLAPKLARYIFKSASTEAVGMMVAALPLILAPLALAPFLSRAGGGRSRLLSGVAMAGCLLGGLLSCLQSPRSAAEMSVRNMTLVHILLPARIKVPPETPPPTPEQARTVSRLLGPANEEGIAAFSSMPRRRYNVLLVVWESVGERYTLHHALGQAPTPNLDRLAARGSVRFRRAYAQSPISVQSVWSLLTGISPPAKPAIFLDPNAMPPHRQTLPEILKSEGYGTAVLIGSYTRAWGADRIVRLGGVDLFEDIQTLANRDRYHQSDWSIDGRALNERFWTWLDQRPRDRPFFSVVWNVETHFPYRWARMKAADAALGNEARYLRSIERADQLLGELSTGLKDRNLEEQTLVIVAGDHGEGTGRPPHPNQLQHGLGVYEDAMQVPLVFLHPSLQPPRNVEAPAVLSDLYPTVLDLLGVPPRGGLDGVSLAGPLPPRSIFLHSIPWWPAAIRSGPYKLIRSSAQTTEGLYNIDHDPLESVNLLRREPMIAAALESHLLFETARRQRFDSSMDADRKGFRTWVPPSASPTPTASRSTPGR